MRPTEKPLFALTAADLMVRDLLTLPQDTPLPEAARRLTHDQVSGAPVVGADGQCVGVLSATDCFRALGREGDAPFLAGPAKAYMTADPVTVAPGTPVRDLARMMLDAHIHRLIVVDERRRPVGVISSTDILAALAYTDRPH
jgi:CBS domain-containing protein